MISFFENSFNSFIQNKKRRCVVLIAALICFVLCYIANLSITKSILLVLMVVVSGMIDTSRISDRRLLIVVYLIASLFFLFITQFIQNESLRQLGVLKVILGLLCILIPFLTLYCITLKHKFSFILVSFVYMILSLINVYVYEFRGSEFCPADIMSAGVALNVISKYTFVLHKTVLIGLTLYICLILLISQLPESKTEKFLKERVVLFIEVIVLFAIFVIEKQNVVPNHFLHGGSYVNGYILNFTLQIEEIIVKKPAQYSIDKVHEISDDYLKVQETGDKKPDIIVIMDEAFSDFRVYGNELNTNREITPYIDSLNENVTKGYCLSSVYGGGTPNSEYEFLSGNSMLFLNGIVYQQFINGPSYSLVRELKSRGYYSMAMHPYLGNGYKRNTVWPYLGFDEINFIDHYPQKNLIRGLVSDREMFEVLVNDYKELKRDHDQLFFFGVTMQNHSAYDYDGNDFSNTIELEGYNGEYPDAEQYLSLINYTDSAVEWLLTELKKIDNDIIVVFYGDHQPALNIKFINELNGSSLDTYDEEMLMYKIPFFVWTNYESDYSEVELTSLNYLSTLMLDKADMSMPAYNLFLNDLMNKIPAMNSKMYYSKANDTFLKLSEADNSEKEILNEYWMLQYNCLLDKKKRNNDLFPMPD